MLYSHSVHRLSLNKSKLICTFPRKLSRWQSSSHFDAAGSDGIHLHLSVLIAPSSWYRSHVPNVTHYSPDYLSLRPSSPAAVSGPIHAKMSPSFCNCFLPSSASGFVPYWGSKGIHDPQSWTTATIGIRMHFLPPFPLPWQW